MLGDPITHSYVQPQSDQEQYCPILLFVSSWLFFWPFSCFSNCQVIKYKRLQFPLPSTTILPYLHSTFVFLVSCYSLLFLPMVTPTIFFLALKYKFVLCSRFYCQVVISHSLKWPHSPFLLGPSSQPADTPKSSSLTIPQSKMLSIPLFLANSRYKPNPTFYFLNFKKSCLHSHLYFFIVHSLFNLLQLCIIL